VPLVHDIMVVKNCERRYGASSNDTNGMLIIEHHRITDTSVSVPFLTAK